MDSKTRRALVSFVAMLLSVLSVALAGPRTNFAGDWNLCVDEIGRIPPDLLRIRIPVGCELVDCCRGCPALDASLDWRIRIDGMPFKSASLVFERLPRERSGRLKLSGSAKGAEEKITIGRGVGRVSGLPVEVAGLPPVAQIDLVLDDHWLHEGLRDQPQIGALVVEQFLGGIPVNAQRISYSLRRCGHPLVDRISLENNAGGDSASVLLDANRDAGCVAEESERGAGIIGVGNLLANGACRSEIVVLSDDDAMQLVEDVHAWTAAAGDTQVVDLTPDRLMAPVSVWLARPDARTSAEADFATANLLYNANNTGIGFTPNYLDVSADGAALAVIGHAVDCLTVDRLRGSAYYTPGTLNVYYVDGADTGINCDLDANVQYVGTLASDTTLAHEFGHSMSLDHSDGYLGAPGPNIMDVLVRMRSSFTDGQAFRMNAQCTSTLNANHVRSGPVRRCDHTLGSVLTCPAATDTHCPRLLIDALPK